MATIGSMAIKLIANTRDFTNNIYASEKSLQKLYDAGRNIFAATRTPLENYKKAAENLKLTLSTGAINADTYARALKAIKAEYHAASGSTSGFSAVTKIAAAAVAGFSLHALGSWIMNAAESVIATNKFAREIGATTQGLSELQYGMRSLGGDNQTLDAGLSTLNQTLGNAVTGGSAAADTFARLGLSAATLASMPTDQAFIKIAGAIAAIPDAGGRAAAAVQIFGESAGALLPLLSQGEAGLAAMADAAKNARQSITDIEAAQIELAGIAAKELGGNLDGVARQIAISLSPWIIAAVDEFRKLGITGKSVSDGIISGFKFVAKGVAMVWDGVRMLGLVLKTIGLGFVVITAGIGSAIQYILEVAAKLPKKLGGDMFKGAAESVKEFNESAYQLAQTMKDEILGTLAAPSTFQKVDAFFEGLEDGAARAADDMQKKLAAKVGKGPGAVALANRFKDVFGEKNKQVFNDVRTPLQAFIDKMTELNFLLKNTALGWDTFARASSKALEALEKSHGLGELKLPAGLVRGSSEAVSAMNNFSLQQSRQLEKPEDRIRRILQQSYEVEQMQLAQQIRIAEALIGGRPKEAKF
jgi:hypothetical protein